ADRNRERRAHHPSRLHRSLPSCCSFLSTGRLHGRRQTCQQCEVSAPSSPLPPLREAKWWGGVGGGGCLNATGVSTMHREPCSDHAKTRSPTPPVSASLRRSTLPTTRFARGGRVSTP